MKIYIVMGGYNDDAWPLYFYLNRERASKRAEAINEETPSLDAYVEEFETED